MVPGLWATGGLQHYVELAASIDLTMQAASSSETSVLVYHTRG